MHEFTNTKRERFAQSLLKRRKPIEINTHLMRGLGYDNTRDFFRAIGDWGYSADFGRFSNATDTRVDLYMRQFIRDEFLN